MDEPEYEIYPFEDVANALREIRRQHDAGEPLVWTGPDRMHFSIAAGLPEPSWHFSEEGLEYNAERGRDFEDAYLQVAFALGFHNGAVKESVNSDAWRTMYYNAQERDKRYIALLEKDLEERDETS